MGFLVLVVLLFGLNGINKIINFSRHIDNSEMTYTSNHAAEDFTVYDKDGNPVRLANHYPEPIVVNFWASWDTLSQEQLPVFEKMYQKYGDQVQFMMVNITDGSKENRESADAYIAEKGYTFPVYYDTDMSAVTAYGTRSIPATYFVNSRFDLMGRANGVIDEETLKKGIKLILKETE